MSIDTSRRIEDLHPAFQPVAQRILQETQDGLEDGSTVRVLCTWRSLADQAEALATGKSKVRLGWHQMGLAIDVGIFNENGVYVTDGADPRYRIYGAAAKANGCVWGGDWQTLKDYAHAEWHVGYTLTQYTTWLEMHKVTS